MKKQKRDPRLPPPEVCNWILQQQWSEPIPSIVSTYPEGHPNGLSRSEKYSYQEAHCAIGVNQTAVLYFPDDALLALKKDAEMRNATKCAEEHGIYKENESTKDL